MDNKQKKRKLELEKALTSKQIRFCREYVLDWNATRSAKEAGYKEKTATVIGSENLTKPNIIEYIEIIKYDYEQNLNLSKMKIIKEQMALAFSSIAHFHNTWVDKKELKDLTEQQRACIKSIKTEIFESRELSYIQLYDKQKAIDSLIKLMKYDDDDSSNYRGNNKLSNITTAYQVSTIYTLNRQYSKHNRIVVNRGGTRSTKSYSIAQIAIDWLVTGEALYFEDDQKQKVFSICRKSSPVLKSTIIKDVISILKERELYDNEVQHHKTEQEFRYDERVIDYFGLDDEQKVRGRKRNYLFIDEANECNIDIFNQLMFRTSGTAFLAFNPDDPHIWINTELEQKRALIDKDVAVIQSSYLNNYFLSRSQIREIERLRSLDTEFWHVFGLGEYGVISGVVYKNWNEFDNLPAGKFHRLLGFDYGSEIDESAILEIHIDRQNMRVYVYEILYETTDRLGFIYDTLGDERDEIIVDSSASTLYNELVNRGYNAIKCIKGQDSILAGIDIVKKYELFIHKDATSVQRELKLYKRPKDDKTGKYLKKPIDMFNHAMDSLRYAITHFDKYYNFGK